MFMGSLPVPGTTSGSRCLLTSGLVDIYTTFTPSILPEVLLVSTLRLFLVSLSLFSCVSTSFSVFWLFDSWIVFLLCLPLIVFLVVWTIACLCHADLCLLIWTVCCWSFFVIKHLHMDSSSSSSESMLQNTSLQKDRVEVSQLKAFIAHYGEVLVTC